MRITLVAIGKIKNTTEEALFNQYVARLPWPLTVQESMCKKPLSGPALKQAEALLLEKHIPAGSKLIALDERGKSLTSAAFAAQIGQWRDSGDNQLTFIIGGADGLDESLRKRADLLLSFGQLTWPHLLVRPLLAEQLYRAHTILSGHPYHRS